MLNWKMDMSKILKQEYFFYYLILVYILIMTIFGLFFDSATNSIVGLKNIINEPDIAVTDYIAVGGLGGAFLNAGINGIFCILMLLILKVKPNGPVIASLFTVIGFSFSGKNLLNIWPIFIGIWIYSKYKRQAFTDFILIAFFGSALSPLVSQFNFSDHFMPELATTLGIFIGIFTGFILPPVTAYASKIHQGYNLYNTGFSAGFITSIIMALYRAFGIEFEKRFIWSTGNNFILSILFVSIFLSMIIIGYYLNNKSFDDFSKLLKSTGRLVSDYKITYGDGITLVNMGVLGIIGIIYILSIDSSLNGPTMAGVFTIVGFGACGKHIKNITPIVIGAITCASLSIWEINTPTIVLATLFSTTLAPISGEFGIGYGLIAGFIHVTLVMNIVGLNAGLNLYNNGFAGGILATILVPIIKSLKKG